MVKVRKASLRIKFLPTIEGKDMAQTCSHEPGHLNTSTPIVGCVLTFAKRKDTPHPKQPNTG